MSFIIFMIVAGLAVAAAELTAQHFRQKSAPAVAVYGLSDFE